MKAGLSPTGRALRALELPQAQPGITGGQLAAQPDVTERAARRYITILREAGIPVESTRGPYGGYRAGRGIRLPPQAAGSSADPGTWTTQTCWSSTPGPDGSSRPGSASMLPAMRPPGTLDRRWAASTAPTTAPDAC